MVHRRTLEQRLVKTGFHRTPLRLIYNLFLILLVLYACHFVNGLFSSRTDSNASRPFLSSDSGSHGTMAMDKREIRYLMFMPWEQLNNQLIGFKAACSMAHLLNRTLVTPMLGYRKPHTADWNFDFDVQSYIWSPMEDYFELGKMPCALVSLKEFKKRHGNKTIGPIHLNRVAKATSSKQLIDYYGNVLGLLFSTIVNQGKMSQLTDEEIVTRFGSNREEVLSFGSLFWTVGFGKVQPYPLVKYITYMDVSMYRDIVGGLQSSRQIQDLARQSLKQSNIGHNPYIAIHVRRGDYWNKCKLLRDANLRRKCYPTVKDIDQQLDAVFIENVWSKRKVSVYISTNLDEKGSSEFTLLMKNYRVLFFRDIFSSKTLTPIQEALLDKELGLLASHFIGNLYSSFSRSILEARELHLLPFNVFE